MRLSPDFPMKFDGPKGGRRPPGGGLNRSPRLPRPEAAVHLDPAAWVRLSGSRAWDPSGYFSQPPARSKIWQECAPARIILACSLMKNINIFAEFRRKRTEGMIKANEEYKRF